MASGAAASIEPLGVEHVAQRAAVQIAAQVVAEEVGDALVFAVAGAGRVRADEDTVHLPQRAVGRQRLFGKNVQRGAAQLAGVQGCDQRRLVDGGTTADVDEEAP